MPEKQDKNVKVTPDKSGSYTLHGQFRDSVVFDAQEKTAISVRDGVLEYFGMELGMKPDDQIFRVYRSPATIANAAMKMAGIPITNDHVSLDSPAPTGDGNVVSAEMIDMADPTCDATIAIRNKLTLGDTLRMLVDAGKREMSLGYTAKLIAHDEHDFEQVNIEPHHLATVERGRCGSICSFIDRKPTEGKNEMKLAKKLNRAFTDEDGVMNLQQVVEMAMSLPEAIKSVPVDKLAELVAPLAAIIEAAKAAGVMPEVEKELGEPVEGEEAVAVEDEADPKEVVADEDKPKFSDKAVVKLTRDFADKAIKEHAYVIEKARDFLPAEYKFADKTTEQIRRDVIATQTTEKFSDSELVLAFKLVKPAAADYSKFGDSKEVTFTNLKDKEL